MTTVTTTKTVKKVKKAKAAKGPATPGSNGVFDALFTTEIIVLLDRSGSMGSIRDDMCGGFNQFVAEQRAEPGKCDLTLVQFDSQSVDVIHEATPIADIPDLVMEPRGGTPLLDAMVETINRVSNRHNALTQPPDKVLFLVITDGEENSSKKYQRKDVKVLVETQTAKGWVFSFLGANVDAFAEASSVGIAVSSSMNYAPNRAGVLHLYASVSSSASSLRSGHGYTPLTPTPGTTTGTSPVTSGVVINPNVSGTLPIDTSSVIDTTAAAQPIDFQKKKKRSL